MNWTDYVGEKFRSKNKDGKIYIIDSYDPTRGFILSEVSNPNNRIHVYTHELAYAFHMSIDCEPPHYFHSIKNHRDGWKLLDRAIINLECSIPIPEQVKMYRSSGFSHWDIYLTISAARCIIRHR